MWRISGQFLIVKGIVIVLVLLLLPALLALASSSSSSSSSTPLAQPTPESLAGLGCSNEVVSFSPCLNYVSTSPPNNLSSQPSTQCCRIFSSVFQKHEAACLCYLVRRPLIYSFRINTTRLYSLSSLCQPNNKLGSHDNDDHDVKTLESLCLGTSTRLHHRHPSNLSSILNSSQVTSDAPSSSSAAGSITESLKSSVILISLAAATLIMNR